jgi:hypothetical protein
MRSQRRAALFLRDQRWIVPTLEELLEVHLIYTEKMEVPRTGPSGWRNKPVEISGLGKLSFKTVDTTNPILEGLFNEAGRRLEFLGSKFNVDFSEGPNQIKSLHLNDEYVLGSLEIMSVTALAILFTQPFGDCNKGTSALIVDHLADYLFGQPEIPLSQPTFDPIQDVKVENFEVNLGNNRKSTRYGEVMRKTWEVRVTRNSWTLEEMAKAVLTPLRPYYPFIGFLPHQIEGRVANSVLSPLDEGIEGL